ncbi:MAG: 50S ribosomal protein L19 [Candidatus Levybacteria bacterium RIFCSPLOWO2_01_FULL_36_13]|nr:MAG: 50S ribosomal protein L19 [Candidatus Levybacteria bacterium RIFCSPHIGHO2_01_FULL_36_15b]OGH35560.1 MAG: 50S ribosomal protein L19 [Candidatus Levybacteria bacterium RIFCSPLOWO2_01_FULL_36_13]
MQRELNFKTGDIIRVFQRIKEGEKTRVQVFEGVVLSIKGRNENKMFTVRKMVGDVAVERIFPFNSPNIEKITVKGKIKQKVRRAKLYFLRQALS